jgi:hypothetical protein
LAIGTEKLLPLYEMDFTSSRGSAVKRCDSVFGEEYKSLIRIKITSMTAFSRAWQYSRIAGSAIAQVVFASVTSSPKQPNGEILKRTVR